MNAVIQSVIYTIHMLHAYTHVDKFYCLCLAVLLLTVNVCVYFCVALKCHIATLCADTAPTATGCTWCVRGVHQLLMLECQMYTHTNTDARIFISCTQLHICSTHSLHMCTYMHSVRPCIDTCSFLSITDYNAWMNNSILTRKKQRTSLDANLY